MRIAASLLVLAISCALPLAAQEDSVKLNILRLDGKKISSDQAKAIAAEELKNDKVMGAQIAIMNGAGKSVWYYAYGFRDAAQTLPMTVNTNIWAASITKAVFGTWVMQLVEQHKLDLDKPLAQMLPKPLNEYKPYRESASELVNDPQWQRVTPRMMLSHTSGLSNIAVLTEPDKKMRLHFTPGSRFAYSGDGLNVLQFVLEEGVIHEPLDVAMQRDIFTPLNMKRTGLVWHDDFAENAAIRYDAHGGRIGATHRDNARAAGSMATSVRDVSLFLDALLNNKLLQPKTRAQMLSPQIKINGAHQFPTLENTPSSEGPQVGLAYGLGWGLLISTKYGPAFFKEGHGDGAENYLICFTRKATCMVMLTNSDNGELAFRPLLEKLLGDTVTPWVWEGYTREQILANEEHKAR